MVIHLMAVRLLPWLLAGAAMLLGCGLADTTSKRIVDLREDLLRDSRERLAASAAVVRLTDEISRLPDARSRREAWTQWQTFLCDVSDLEALRRKSGKVDVNPTAPTPESRAIVVSSALTLFGPMGGSTDVTQWASMQLIWSLNLCVLGRPEESWCQRHEASPARSTGDPPPGSMPSREAEELAEAVTRGDAQRLVDFYETRIAGNASEIDRGDRWKLWTSAMLATASRPLPPEDRTRLEMVLAGAERMAPLPMLGRITAASVLLRQQAGQAEAAVALVTATDERAEAITDEDLGYLLSLRAQSLEALDRHEEAFEDHLRAATLNRAAGNLEEAARLAAIGQGTWATDTRLVRLADVAVQTAQHRIAKGLLGPLMTRAPGLPETTALAVLRTFVRMQVKSQTSLVEYRRDWQPIVAAIRVADRRTPGELAKAIDDAWSDRVYEFAGAERGEIERLPRWLRKDGAARREMAQLMTWIGQAFIESDDRLLTLGVNRFLAAWRLDPDDREALELAAASLAGEGGRSVPPDVRHAFEDAFEDGLLRYARQAADKMRKVGDALNTRLEREKMREDTRAARDLTWGLSLVGDVALQSSDEDRKRLGTYLHSLSAKSEESVNFMRCAAGEPRIDVTRLWDVLLDSSVQNLQPQTPKELAAIAAYDSLVKTDFARARRFAETAISIRSSPGHLGSAWMEQLGLTLAVTEPRGSSILP